ncbi:hypothetical protein P5V15_008989 [Pogonomyrmex californicus]
MLPKKDSQTEPYALEDMISDLQARRHSLDHEDVVQDPAELLKQRERDLVLAAELGKALLERNQELTKQAETLAEEYSVKLEVSEHILFKQILVRSVSKIVARPVCSIHFTINSRKK